MRITFTSVFGVTLLSGWVCIAAFADHNTYIVRADGTRTLKDRATVSDRIIGGALGGVPFAALTTGLLWALHRFRQRDSAS
jgi:hypothetical protein